MAGSALLAILIPYSTGVQGYAFLLTAIIAFFVILSFAGFIVGTFFAKLEIYQDPNDTRILRI